MRAIIEIEMDGAAFEDKANELGWIIRQWGNALMESEDLRPATLRDSNGNTCGSFRIEE